ncbi:hypothetical protein ACFYXF_34950 [Streptomyces sp. NPDC002680]
MPARGGAYRHEHSRGTEVGEQHCGAKRLLVLGEKLVRHTHK